MSSKSDSYYFNTFAECASLACEAAEVLHSVLTKFNSEEIDDIMRELHEVEHKADEKKHDMLSALLKAFITPIERDDIMNLSQAIDDITDSVEDVVIQINMDQVKSHPSGQHRVFGATHPLLPKGEGAARRVPQFQEIQNHQGYHHRNQPP